MLLKKINKIYSKINQIAKKGDEGFDEYCSYVDELISLNEYELFYETLCRKYNIIIDIDKYLIETKERSYRLIRLQTVSPFQDLQKKLYQSEVVYQVGLYIYDDVTNNKYGMIMEVEQDSPQIYYKDPLLFKIQDEIKLINLHAVRNNGEYLDIEEDDKPLIQKYKEAIWFLKGYEQMPFTADNVTITADTTITTDTNILYQS